MAGCPTALWPNFQQTPKILQYIIKRGAKIFRIDFANLKIGGRGYTLHPTTPNESIREKLVDSFIGGNPPP